jgi:hypothetical protein
MKKGEGKRAVLNNAYIHLMLARQAISSWQLTAVYTANIRIKLNFLFLPFFNVVSYIRKTGEPTI